VVALALGGDDGDRVTVTTPGDTGTTALPSTTTSSSTTVVPAVSVRDIDFRSHTYQAPCPSVLDAGPCDVTLADVATGSEQGYSVALDELAYLDVDGDGAEEAMVALYYHHQRAEDSAAWVGVFGVDAAGRPHPVGAPLVADFIDERHPDTGAPKTPHAWEFDGSAFRPVDP